MKILLINPFGSNWVEGRKDHTPTAIRMAPVGILSIAAYLLQANQEVKVYDCQNLPTKINHEKVLTCVNTFKPDIVGFTAVTSSFMNAYFLAEAIKLQAPQTRIVFGGVHVSALRGKILEKFSAIDFVVTGEGEKALADLAAGAPAQTIQGLVYRQSLSIRENDFRTDLCQLDSLPFPAYAAPQILARHKTKVDFAAMKSTVEKIQKAGLRAKGLFMMGLPGETESTIQMTANFINELKLDDMNMTKFTPFPGSPIYQNIREEGVFEEKWGLMNCLNFVFVPQGIRSKERLDALYNQFVQKFYTGKNWMNKFGLLCFKSPHSVYRLIKDLPVFLKIKSDFKPQPKSKLCAYS